MRKDILDLLSSDVVGVRLHRQLQPAEGAGEPVRPPWLESDGLWSRRHNPQSGTKEDVVTLDTLQSQVNRMEESILELASLMGVVPEFALHDQSGRRQIVGNRPGRHADWSYRSTTNKDLKNFFAWLRFEAGVKATGPAVELDAALCGTPMWARLAAFAPTSLLFGFWDSYSGNDRRRLQRSLSKRIVGVDPAVTKEEWLCQTDRGWRIDLPGLDVAGEDEGALRSLVEDLGFTPPAKSFKRSNYGLGSIGVGGGDPKAKAEPIAHTAISFGSIEQTGFFDIRGIKAATNERPATSDGSDEIYDNLATAVLLLAAAAFLADTNQPLALRSGTTLVSKGTPTISAVWADGSETLLDPETFSCEVISGALVAHFDTSTSVVEACWRSKRSIDIEVPSNVMDAFCPDTPLQEG